MSKVLVSFLIRFFFFFLLENEEIQRRDGGRDEIN